MLCKGVRVSPSVQESDGDEGVDEGEEEEQQEHEYDDRSTPPSPAGDSDVMLSSTWAPNTDATDAGNGFIMLQARILLGHLSLASVNEENLVRDTSHSCQRFRSNIWDEVAKLTAKTRDRCQSIFSENHKVHKKICDLKQRGGFEWDHEKKRIVVPSANLEMLWRGLRKVSFFVLMSWRVES